MVDSVKDCRRGVVSVLGAAFVLFGIVGCDSGERVAEPTVEVVEATAAATVVIAEPTATLVADTPTVVVEPTATVAVEATATMAMVATEGPAVDSAVDDDVDLESLTDRVYDLAIFLAEDLSPRQSATDEELAAAEFLLEEMDDLGYEVEVQDFEVFDAGPSGSLEVLAGSDGSTPSVTFSRQDGDTHRIFFLPFEPLKIGKATGEMVYAGLGEIKDFEGVDVDGKIALMRRGVLSFEDKETNAAERGAVGVVVFNNEPRFYFGGRLEQEPDILAGGIPRGDGDRIQRALEDGEEVSVELLVYPIGNGPSRNVIAELNNDIVGDQVVLIGAHYDTTPWSAGANDNGSGMAAALIVAEELSDDDLPFDIRFVFFGSEETGLHGSNYYAGELSQSEVDRIEAMVNLDVVATGDLEVFGDETLTGYAEGAAEEYGVDLMLAEPFEWGASDYVGFDERGVPFIMFYADELDYINHPSDTLEHVEAEPLVGTVAIVLGIIERLADSMER